MITMQKTEKKLHMEFLRIIAIFCVLFNHTGTKGFVLFTAARDSVLYWFYMFFGIAIKVGVPLFFMISGALLLEKEDRIGTILKKRVAKILIVMFAGSILVYLHKLGGDFAAFSVKELLTNLYIGNVTTAYWYFYAYLAFLLLLPFLRKIAKGLSNQEYHYMIALYLLIQGLIILQLYGLMGLSYNHNFSLFITEQIVFYPLLGYYVEHRLPKERYNKKTITGLVIASVIAIGLMCMMTHRYCTIFNKWDEVSAQKYFELLIFIPAAMLYFCSKYYFSNHTIWKWAEKLIVIAGSATFGIFLLERIYRAETYPIYEMLCPYIHSFPASIIWAGCACVLGCIVTLLLKCIPGVKKFL